MDRHHSLTPKPDPSKYVSHPPVYPVGPPIWLHPDWPNIGEPKPPPPIEPQAVSITDRMDVIRECDYRRKTDSCGCSGRWLCDLRRGQTYPEWSWGVVALSDCGACVAPS